MKRSEFLRIAVSAPVMALLASSLPAQRIVRSEDPEAEWLRFTAPHVDSGHIATIVGYASEANLSTAEITVGAGALRFDSVALVFNTPKWVKDKYPDVRVMRQGEKRPVGVALYRVGLPTTRVCTLRWKVEKGKLKCA